MEVAQLQERYYHQNRIYGDLSDLGYAADTMGVSKDNQLVAAGDGLYDITIEDDPAPSATAYQAIATAMNKQASDTDCATLSVNQTTQQLPIACW